VGVQRLHRGSTALKHHVILSNVVIRRLRPWMLVPGLLAEYPAQTSKRMKAPFLVARICQTRRYPHYSGHIVRNVKWHAKGGLPLKSIKTIPEHRQLHYLIN
jgi:hypothetical protein